MLIQKTGKPTELPNSYRPLCLIHSIAKLLETVHKDRLSNEIQLKADLASNQYGFKKEKSTLDALDEVQNTTRKGE